MSELDNRPVMSSGTPGLAGWVQIWIKAFTKPNEQTFIEISESPDVKVQTALIWAVIAGLIVGIFAGIGTAVGALIQGAFDSSAISAIAGFVCGFPILFAIVFPISLAFSAALFQWVAKLFGGTGSFEKLLYSLSAIATPLAVISGASSLVSGIPIVGSCVTLFTSVVSIYAIVLNIMAVKAVNRFGWGQAAGSVLIPSFVVFIGFACVGVIGALVFGTALSGYLSGGFGP